MSTEAQRKANTDNTREVMRIAANGDPDAYEFLIRFAAAARIIDDLVDQDHPVSREQIIYAFEAWALEIPANKFYRKNFDQLHATLALIWNAWLDSEQLKEGDEAQRQAAKGLKFLINDLPIAVARLTGGIDYMRAVSLPIRNTFIKGAT